MSPSPSTQMPGRPAQLAVAGARPSRLEQEVSLGGELLHPVVAPVGDVHIAELVHVDAPRHVELAGAVSEAAPLEDEPPVSGELLDAVVHRVDHIEILVRVEGYARRPVELSVAAAVLAPHADELALGRHEGDAVQGLVGDYDVLVAVEEHLGGPHHLALARALRADVAQVGVVVPAHPCYLSYAPGALELAKGQDPHVAGHGYVDRPVDDAPHAHRLQVGKAGPQ